MDTQTGLTGRTRQAQQLKQAAAFFFEHAGYSYDPARETADQGRKRCAIELARAERDARAQGIWFSWDRDEEGCAGGDYKPCKSDPLGPRHLVMYCIAKRNKPGQDHVYDVLASLSGICEPSPEYRRVVEAELAMEALAELERARA